MAWKFHVDDSNNSRYDIILGRDLLTALVLNLISCDQIIGAYDEPFKGSMGSIDNLGTYEFKYLETRVNYT